MTPVPVRRLLIDLNEPFDRRWNGGDAFRTAFFIAFFTATLPPSRILPDTIHLPRVQPDFA